MAGGNYDRSKKKSQLNPAVSYCFGLQVEATFFVPLRSVRVFTKENEFDYYQEGGLNDYVHMLRKPISKPFTFQVERYVGVDSGMFDANSGFLDPLALGTDLILPVILYVNRAQTKNAGENFSFKNCARAYIFTGCTVTSKEYGELNAEQSKLLTETTTIAYRELFAINQFDPSWERGAQWEFTPDSDNTVKKGKIEGKNSHPENRSKNDSRETREKKAEETRWKISKTNFNGNAKRHIPTVDNTPKNDTKETREKKGNAEKWAFKPPTNSTDPLNPTPYTGNAQFHTNPLGRKNDSRSTGEGKGKDKKWEIEKDKYQGNNKFHTDEKSRKNDSKAKLEKAGKANLWLWDKQHPKGGPKDHMENRAKNNDPKSKGESTGKEKMWQFGPDLKNAITPTPYAGNSNFHTNEKGRKNNPKSKGESDGKEKKWDIAKDKFEGNSKFHTDEKARKNDTKSTGESKGTGGKWEISKDKFDGNSKFHTDEKARKNDPKSKGESDGKGKMWEINKDNYAGNSQYHTDERGRKNDPKSKGESNGKGNQWVYDGSVNGQGKSHTTNRNTNQKPEPVKWPPTRRALMAQALSDK